MGNKKDELIKLVGADNVIDDPEILASYSSDLSFAAARKPQLVVKPRNADEVQKIVVWANQARTPVVPVSSGPPHFHGDTVPTAPDAVIVDLSSMNRILGIDRRNRNVTVEPGVTFRQLMPELAKEGMTISTPLLPRSTKSVLASLIEREPTIIPRYQYSLLEPMRGLTLVWGNGEKFNTGSAGSPVHPPLVAYGPGQADWCRFITGAQGCMAIVTSMGIRCKALADPHQLLFVSAEKLDSLVPLAYRVQRFRYGDELLILNSLNLAAILGDGVDQVRALKDELPPWVLIIGIAGRSRLPRERVEYQEKDIAVFAQELGLRLLQALPAVSHSQTKDALFSYTREPYWKLAYQGGCQDIFFLTTLNKTPDFVKTMFSVAESQGYSSSDIGVYIQPQQQGVCSHCEFNLFFNPGDPGEAGRIKVLFDKSSEELSKQGAYFSRPYGMWSGLAFARDAQTAMVLKKVKGLFDPNNVMNPGKLCF